MPFMVDDEHQGMMATLSSLLLPIALSLAAVQAPKIDLSEKALTALAAKYVAGYEKEFAFLIADEHYTQARINASGRTVQTRVLRSELFLTYLPADGEWIAVRDVMEVDGVPVTQREDLRAFLSQKDQLHGLTSRLVARNAQYNIGSVTRNFNEPTLPLLLLEEKRISPVKFDRKRVERDGAATLATLAFEERGSGTLVSERQGPVPAKGEFVLDVSTGAITRTLFLLKRPGVDVRLETTYVKDDKLDLWLPSVFTERYVSGAFTIGSRSVIRDRETIECEARYANYRRFEVTARIK